MSTERHIQIYVVYRYCFFSCTQITEPWHCPSDLYTSALAKTQRVPLLRFKVKQSLLNSAVSSAWLMREKSWPTHEPSTHQQQRVHESEQEVARYTSCIPHTLKSQCTQYPVTVSDHLHTVWLSQSWWHDTFSCSETSPRHTDFYNQSYKLGICEYTNWVTVENMKCMKPKILDFQLAALPHSFCLVRPIEHVHQRLLLTEPANFHSSTQLTRMG